MNVSRSASKTIALVGALAAAGCAPVGPAAGPERAALLSEAPATERQCVVSSRPRELVPADLMVDSAALRADLERLAGDGPPGYVLLSMVFDTTGINIRREVIEHNVRPLVADSVQRLVFGHRRELDASDERLGVRLRLDLGPQVSMRVGRQELCPPVPLDPALETALVHFRSSGLRYRGGRRERTIWVRVLVNSHGTVVGSQIERGGVGGVDFERSVFDFVRRYSFRPATEDGMPVRGQILVPIRVRAD